MAAEKLVLGGVVKGGVVVPVGELLLPEGAYVEIIFPFTQANSELQAEFGDWDRAGTDAWAVIGRQEKLEALLLEGLDSGPSVPMTPQDRQDIRQEVRKRVAQNGGAGAKKMVENIGLNNGTEPVPEQNPAPTSNGAIIKDHPLASSAGIFADDPLWDEFIQAMEDTRREIDAANPVEG